MKHASSLAYAMSMKLDGRETGIQELLIVEDHPVMGDALSLILKIEFGLRAVRTEQSLERAINALRRGPVPNAILLDLRLPDCSGIEGVIVLRKLAPDVPIIVISADTNGKMISAALAAGARGYISKELGREDLCAALHRAFKGERVMPDGFDPDSIDPTKQEERGQIADRFVSLTPQQFRILRLICAGMANKEISYELSITEATVKTHVNAIMGKINVRRRTQAVRMANEAKLFDFAELD